MGIRRDFWSDTGPPNTQSQIRGARSAHSHLWDLTRPTTQFRRVAGLPKKSIVGLQVLSKGGPSLFQLGVLVQHLECQEEALVNPIRHFGTTQKVTTILLVWMVVGAQ